MWFVFNLLTTTGPLLAVRKGVQCLHKTTVSNRLPFLCFMFRGYDTFHARCTLKVHGGGKRLHHEFRALYDFYGKRVDYGEGEFPSYWPTDMAQASAAPPVDRCGLVLVLRVLAAHALLGADSPVGDEHKRVAFLSQRPSS